MIFTHCSRWSKNYLQLLVPSYRQNIKSSMLYMSNKRKKSNLSDYIVWLDMEMTGLDINRSQILEIACLITDKDLNAISKDLNIVLYQPDEILNNMNHWCLATHQKNGLINESRLSKITIQDAEQIILKYLKSYIEDGTCPLAGNSVYMDRMFLQKYMPSVNNYLHYRIIDVSTIKSLVMRWNTNILIPTKNVNHRALFDIKESIKELQYYKNNIFDLCVK